MLSSCSRLVIAESARSRQGQAILNIHDGFTWFVWVQKTDQETRHSSCLATTDCIANFEYNTAISGFPRRPPTFVATQRSIAENTTGAHSVLAYSTPRAQVYKYSPFRASSIASRKSFSSRPCSFFALERSSFTCRPASVSTRESPSMLISL